MTRKQKKVLARIIIAAVMMVALHFIEIPGPWEILAFLVPYLVIGYDILRKAGRNIIHGQVFDENFLMIVATIGAMVLGDYPESVAVMLFYQVGEFFQSYAVGKSRRNISDLMDIRPDYANIENAEGELEQVDPDEVEVGSIIVIRTGEKVPIDGIIVEGETSLNTSALTGESLPRDAAEGDEVISGCINMSGLIKVKTTKAFGESTASKILDLVENSGYNKSSSEAFITRFARVYTPIVCLAALLTAVLPPLVMMAMGNDPMWSQWLMRAFTFLVISCPCALVISIPLSFFAGIGGASNQGILVKGSNYLEALSKVHNVVFDKTGTMTKGVFEVVAIHHSPLSDQELLKFAALAESYSSHPIAKCIQKAYKGKLDKSLIEGVKEYGGHGVVAQIDGMTVVVGNDKLMEEQGVNATVCHNHGTLIHVAIDKQYFGHILVRDVIKPTSHKAIEKLHALGMKQVVMLTGDRADIAKEVADDLGIHKVYSELLPEDKVTKFAEIKDAAEEKDKSAFIGDGINDAPVLSMADVGIAMGALGADAAIEAADVVLMDDDPLKIAKSIRIAKKTMGIVYQNIYFAIGIKVLCLILSFFGIANMWMAIFADTGVMILAVINAMRCLHVKNL